MKKLTKKEFLARCENIYDMGLTDPSIIKHLERAYDAIFRLEGDQFNYFVDFIMDERERTRNFQNDMQLANDRLGYDVTRLLAILTHPCQICAIDLEAWHTRSGFCPHSMLKKESLSYCKKHSLYHGKKYKSCNT